MTNTTLPRRGATIAAFTVLSALIGLAYGNSLANGFVFDDTAYIDSPAIRDVDLVELAVGNWRNLDLYRPLTLISLATDGALWGRRPVGYHLTNVLLHALLSVAVWALTRQLLSDRVPAGLGAPLVAALVFALHPMQSEVVNWISARGDLLAGNLLALGLLAHRRATAEQPRRAWRGLALVCCVLAPLAKETGFLFVPLAWWIDRARPGAQPGQSAREMGRTYALYVILTGVVLLLRTAIVSHGGAAPESTNFLAAATLPGRLASAVAILGRYAALVLVPRDLSADYSFDSIPVSGWADPWFYAGLCVLAGLLWSARGAPGVAALSAGMVLICWLPVANLVLLPPNAMAERYLYVGFFGISLGAGVLADRFVCGPGRRRAICVALLVLVAGAWMLRVQQRNRDWRDDGTLFADVRAQFPRNVRALENLGHWHARHGDVARAAGLYQEALVVRPENPRALANLGALELRRGRFEAAAEALSGALELQPRWLPVQLDLAGTLEHLGRRQAAARHYRAVLETVPDHPQAKAGLRRVSANPELQVPAP